MKKKPGLFAILRTHTDWIIPTAAVVLVFTGAHRGHLVRGLRARRHGPVFALGHEVGAVADGEDAVVTRGL